MKVRVAVALILLVGVLDDMVAGFVRVPDGTAVVEGARRLSKVGSLKSTATSAPGTPEDTDDDDAEDADNIDNMSLADMCALNGDSETFANALGKIEAVMDNIGAIVNSPEFDEKALESNRTDDASHVIKYMCSKKDDFKTYLEEIAEPLKTCFDSQTKLAIDGLKNITAGFLEFMCQNEGSAFTNFVNNRGMECASDRGMTLVTCTRDLFADTVEEAIAAAHGGTSDEEECNQMTSARTCIKTEFEACENTSNVDFVVGVIDYFLTAVCGGVGETAEVKNTEE